MKSQGKGAGGIVYKAVHVPSLRIVAIKKIAVFDQDKRHQMVRELKALYKNLVPIAGAGSSTARGSIREGPCPYIVAFHDAFITRKYLSERAAREWSTVVDISMTPPSFKPVSLTLSRSPLSKTHKEVFFNPINIFDTFTTLFYYYQSTFSF